MFLKLNLPTGKRTDKKHSGKCGVVVCIPYTVAYKTSYLLLVCNANFRSIF